MEEGRHATPVPARLEVVRGGGEGKRDGDRGGGGHMEEGRRVVPAQARFEAARGGGEGEGDDGRGGGGAEGKLRELTKWTIRLEEITQEWEVTQELGTPDPARKRI